MFIFRQKKRNLPPSQTDQRNRIPRLNNTSQFTAISKNVQNNDNQSTNINQSNNLSQINNNNNTNIYHNQIVNLFIIIINRQSVKLVHSKY